MAADTTDRTDVLSRRTGAALIDLVLMAILFVILAFLIGDTDSGDGEASIALNGLPAVLYFLLVFGYYGITEAMTGQTLGKRLFGVRVARTDGGRPAGTAIGLRTLLRIIDGLPA